MNINGFPVITPKQLIDAAIENGGVESVRYIVTRDHNPSVSAIVTVGGRDLEESASWTDIEVGYKPGVAETLEDKIELLKKRTAVRIIRDVCPDILSRLN